MDRNLKCIGVVLAGGQSRRMGEDKALLQLESGQTLIQQSLSLLKQTGLDKIIISGDRDNGIADQIAGMGPLAAIETIIHKTQASRLLIIPVDMPLLTSELLKLLLQPATKDESAYFHQHYLPLNLAVTAKTKKIIRHLLELQDTKQRSLKNLLEQIPTNILKFEKKYTDALQNINTPEQWQQFKTTYKVELKNVP